MTFRFAFKTSFGHLQDVLARCLACLGKTSLRYLVDVFLPTGHLCAIVLTEVMSQDVSKKIFSEYYESFP